MHNSHRGSSASDSHTSPGLGREETPVGATHERSSVLLVDDRPANLDALEALLQPLDLRLVRASSATEALREVLRNDFAVMLIDVQMPDMDGPQTARLIKARAKSELVPIIFLTAIERDRRRITAAYECGAVDYLTKPLDPEVLRAKVRAFVELHEKREDATWRQRRRFADLVEQTRIDAEVARRAVEERLWLALDAARMVAWEWEPTRGRMTTTGNVQEIYGVPSLASAAAALSLVHPDDRERQRATLRAAVDEGKGYHSEFRIVRPDTNEIVWLDEHGAVVRDSQGRRTGMAGVVVDISERKRIEAERERLLADEREARSRAEMADRIKSEFLATMSHELRTPLNAIVGYVELVEMGIAGQVTPQQRDYLARVRASGRHLLGLVNDVLDLAKVEAGEIDVQREQVFAGSAIEAALALAQPEADARGISLVMQYAERLGPCLADEHRVRQILVNLLSNAVKFTEPGGGIVVDCAMVHGTPPGLRGAGDGPWVVTRVRDTGIGIAAEQLEAVFGAFHQVEQGTTRTRGGTGLGLAISRRLARLMGGDLTLESEVGRGSTFSLWLPGAGLAARDEVEHHA